MKHFRNLATMLAIAILVIFSSCNKKRGSDPEPQGKATSEELTFGTWVPKTGGITNNGTPRDEWVGFTLKFTANTTAYDGGSYTSGPLPQITDIDRVWKTSGTWAFGKNGDQLILGTIYRDNDLSIPVAITVSSANGGTLRMEFTVPVLGARTAGIEGTWVFDMILQ
ncbi:MAG: hypothetical protein OEY56_04880 [Cyclobacteriaceae bacterium]|nr:hypothetical protein [Cyclobacteriaceae bacterium]